MFNHYRSGLAHQVTLAHRYLTAWICVYTDAPDVFWSGIVTLIQRTDLSKQHHEQGHGPLTFLFVRINKRQISWSTIDEEAYAVMEAFERMHWLLGDLQGFDFCMDHKSMIYISNPTSIATTLVKNDMQSSALDRLAFRVQLHLRAYHRNGLYLDRSVRALVGYFAEHLPSRPRPGAFFVFSRKLRLADKRSICQGASRRPRGLASLDHCQGQQQRFVQEL